MGQSRWLGFRSDRSQKWPCRRLRTVPALRLEASDNVFHTRHVFEFQHQVKAALPLGEADACMARMVGWQGDRNVYAVDGVILKLTRAAPFVMGGIGGACALARFCRASANSLTFCGTLFAHQSEPNRSSNLSVMRSRTEFSKQ